MNVKAYMELLTIARLEGINRSDGINAREEALKEWIREWITEVSVSQDVIKNVFTSEEEDALKYYMAGKLSELLMEDCVILDNEPKKITTRLAAIKR